MMYGIIMDVGIQQQKCHPTKKYFEMTLTDHKLWWISKAVISQEEQQCETAAYLALSLW